MGAPQYYALIVLIVVSTALVLIVQHGVVAEFGSASFDIEESFLENEPDQRPGVIRASSHPNTESPIENPTKIPMEAPIESPMGRPIEKPREDDELLSQPDLTMPSSGTPDSRRHNGRFAMLLTVGEQINQAIRSVKQVLKICKATNRTFVIPFVHNSRIRTPSWDKEKESLSQYFDFDKLRAYHPFIVEFSVFQEHVAKQKVKAITHNKIPGPIAGCHKHDAAFASNKLGYTVSDISCYSSSTPHKWLLEQSRQYDGSIVFLDYNKLAWHEGGVPEFEPSLYLRQVVEAFKKQYLRGPYLSLQWRMERTPFKEGKEILQRMLAETNATLTNNPTIKHVLLSTDMSWEFGTKTLDDREFTRWSPILQTLVESLPIRPIAYDPAKSATKLDSGMVGIVDQQLHVESMVFIPAMVRSGYVKTILRKREQLKRPYVLLLKSDRHIWGKDLQVYRRNGVLRQEEISG